MCIAYYPAQAIIIVILTEIVASEKLVIFNLGSYGVLIEGWLLDQKVYSRESLTFLMFLTQ